MDLISSVCILLCVLCVVITPIAFIVWVVMLIRKSERRRKAKRFFLCSLVGIVLFTVVGIITLPSASCEHEWETIEQTKPTCTESGTVVERCALCDIEREPKEVPPTGHIYTETIVQEASCASTGLVEKSCSVCNEVESVATEKTPHAYEVTSTKEATFEAPGTEESTCSVCGDVKRKEIAKLGTKDNPGKVTVEQLVSEINSNQDAAKAKYNGQWIEITGKVLEAGNVAGMGRFCLYGAFGVDSLRIVCWVNEEVLAPFTYQGTTVTFLGQVREITTFNATEIGDCQIISE